MFDLDSGVGTVTVTTSSHSNLGPSHWAERAADTIVSVGSSAHPAIAEQKLLRHTYTKLCSITYGKR